MVAQTIIRAKTLQVRMAIVNPNTLFCCLAWFFLLIPLYSFSLFLPTIIKALGYTSTKAQLLTVPPNVRKTSPDASPSISS